MDLVPREVTLIMKLAVTRDCFPGRHDAASSIVLDLRCPRVSLLIGLQREWRNFPCAVADDTVLIQDRRHVLRIGDSPKFGGLGDGAIVSEDRTSERKRARILDRFAGENRIEGFTHIVP